ncbi:MAG: hypothetical protein ACE5JI_21525, partial [Acidobacteriota bacterium]
MQPRLDIEDPDDDWWGILDRIASQAPEALRRSRRMMMSREHCDNWRRRHGISYIQALNTATAMESKLVWDPKKKMWTYGTGWIGTIWPTFRRWSTNGYRRQEPGRQE